MSSYGRCRGAWRPLSDGDRASGHESTTGPGSRSAGTTPRRAAIRGYYRRRTSLAPWSRKSVRGTGPEAANSP